MSDERLEVQVKRAGALRVRPARADDADALCLIYNQGIEDRVATLETERRTPEERRQWLAARARPAPQRPRQPRRLASTRPALANVGLR